MFFFRVLKETRDDKGDHKNNLSFSELTYKIEDLMGAGAVTVSERKF